MNIDQAKHCADIIVVRLDGLINSGSGATIHKARTHKSAVLIYLNMLDKPGRYRQDEIVNFLEEAIDAAESYIIKVALR